MELVLVELDAGAELDVTECSEVVPRWRTTRAEAAQAESVRAGAARASRVVPRAEARSAERAGDVGWVRE
jgi:hypothetical protein